MSISLLASCASVTPNDNSDGSSGGIHVPCTHGGGDGNFFGSTEKKRGGPEFGWRQDSNGGDTGGDTAGIWNVDASVKVYI